MKTFLISFIGLTFVSYILTCWAVVDVALKQFSSLGQKVIWAVVALIPFVGWLIYFLLGRRKGVRTARISAEQS